MAPAEIHRRFAYVAPDDVRRAQHEKVRALCTELALALDELLPVCPEKDRAVDAVDDACKHANAAIARGPVPPPEEGTAGMREPRDPNLIPTGPFAGGGVNTRGGSQVHVYLDSRDPYPNIVRWAQMDAARNGPMRN